MDKQRIMLLLRDLKWSINSVQEATEKDDFILAEEALTVAESDLAELRKLLEKPPSHRGD
jgi:hypothetical protein